MDRRSFVQFCVGAAAAGAFAASAWSMARPLVIPRLGGGAQVRYIGAQRVAGPAPRGLPFIPIKLNAKGEFEGKPTVVLGGEETSVLDWYKYCGHQGAPGLSPANQNDANGLKYFIAEEKIAAVNPWYVDLLEKPVKPGDFPDVEFGAGFQWRSDGQEGVNLLTGAIVRYAKDSIRYLQSGVINPAKPLKSEEFDEVVKEFFVTTEDSVYTAVSTFCTHFCCIPGYKEAEKLARARNAWDKLYCTCHNSVYEAREPVAYTFFPDVAKEGGAEAGAGGH